MLATEPKPLEPARMLFRKNVPNRLAPKRGSTTLSLDFFFFIFFFHCQLKIARSTTKIACSPPVLHNARTQSILSQPCLGRVAFLVDERRRLAKTLR